MSCRSFIQRYISTLPEGQVFTTRDCLVYGTRATVDKALQRFVRLEQIIRLARGVFVRNIGNIKIPTMLEMAIIKAKAFGKELRIHGMDTASIHKLVEAGNQEPTYYVDGSTSSFAYQGRQIHLKKASKKRMMMSDSNAGRAIRALWAIGRKAIRWSHLDKISHLWHSNNEEKQKIYLAKAWMPAWLGDFFPPTRYLGPEPNWLKASAPCPGVRCNPEGSYVPFRRINKLGKSRS